LKRLSGTVLTVPIGGAFVPFSDVGTLLVRYLIASKIFADNF
jgi:hypothetical protein